MSFYTLGNVPYPDDVPTDGSDKINSSTYVFKITEESTGHTMMFPAFIESLKYNTTKELDYQSEADKWIKIIREYTGDFTIDVKLMLPAASPQQAKTNVAKLENLQKLLLNPYRAIPDYSDNYDSGIQKRLKNVVGPLFKVSFANLIHNGNSGGFPCTIESINYAPEMEMGFFEYEGPDAKYEFLYPKVLSLDLKLKLENQNEKLDFVPITSYDTYSFSKNLPNNNRDSGKFPFGLPSNLEDYKRAYAIAKKLSYNREYYIYLQRGNAKVVFPAFLSGFNRNFEVNQNYIESKSNYVGKGTDTGKLATPSKLSYDVAISVPCASMEESKVFASQIQILMRMFYRQRSGSMRDFGFSVYIPGFIEGDGSKPFTNLNGSQNTEELGSGEGNEITVEATRDSNNVAGLWMEDLNIEIEKEMGFFDEQTDLWPKSYKVSFSLISDMTDGYIYPHKITTERNGSVAATTINIKDNFPFNRSTIKIGE